MAIDLDGPLPRSIGACADLYADVRQIRLAMQKEVDRVAAREREIKEHIIKALEKSDDTGAAGKRYRAQLVQKTVPTIADWKHFTEFVRKTGRFDLVQKRLSQKAVMDMWEEGETVPGVEPFHTVDVSIRKI